MNLNNLFKIFLKQREKSINVNIVNNYHSYPDNSYQDNGYFDNIYNVGENNYYVNTEQSNNYYQEYNTQEPYEIPSHDVYLLEDVKSPPKYEDIIYSTPVEYFNPTAPTSPPPVPPLSQISTCENDLNIRSISNEDIFKDDSETCSICLCDFKEMKTITLTNCHHKFHYKCIKEWLLDNDRCPLCNEDQTKLKKRLNF